MRSGMREFLRWSAHCGQAVGGNASWAVLDGSVFRVGWQDYAEYEMDAAPGSVVRVTLGAVSEEEALVCFLLSVVPLALPLFDLEPLHGSAVRCGEEALLLLGASRAGKSSLAASLSRLGYGFLTDDACALDASGLLWPGPPLVALRNGDAERGIVGRYTDKTVALAPNHNPEPLRAARTVILQPGSGTSLAIRPVPAREAFAALLKHVRAPGVLSARRRELQLRVVARMADLPVGVLTYEPGRHSPDQTATVIDGWMAGRKDQL